MKIKDVFEYDRSVVTNTVSILLAAQNAQNKKQVIKMYKPKVNRISKDKKMEYDIREYIHEKTWSQVFRIAWIPIGHIINETIIEEANK